MTTSIYVPHFAEGKNYTVKYAEILRPCNVLVTAYTQCADNVMREHKYSLRCTTSIAAFNDYTPAVDLSDWTFKSLNADDHIVKIFLQYENGKIYLCADASVVKLIELKTIVPADIVSVNILRLEPLSYIRVEEDEYCLNPHFNSFCFHIALEPGEQSTFIAQSVGGKSVRTSIEAVFQGNPTMNNGLMESVSSGGYERLTISATDERQEFYLMISDIRNLKYFEMPDHVCESFPLSSVRYCDLLTGLFVKEGATGSSVSLQSLRHFDTLVVDNTGIDIDLAHFANTRLKWLDIRVGTNTNNLSFTIDALASYDNKSYLESIFFRGEYAHQLQGITGSLGSLSGFHYLRELVIPYTGITGELSGLKNTSILKIVASECNFTGRLSDLPPTCYSFSNIGGSTGTIFTWDRAARTNKQSRILRINSENSTTGTNTTISGKDINNMLEDQAHCAQFEVNTEQDNSIANKIIVHTDDNHIQLDRNNAYQWLRILLTIGITDLKIDEDIFIKDGILSTDNL